jgi:uncharacterized OB-fold protein
MGEELGFGDAEEPEEALLETNRCPVCQTEIGPNQTYCDDCRKFGLDTDKLPCPFCSFENSWMATRCVKCGKDL